MFWLLIGLVGTVKRLTEESRGHTLQLCSQWCVQGILAKDQVWVLLALMRTLIYGQLQPQQSALISSVAMSRVVGDLAEMGALEDACSPP
jgi:hypothetical protein